MKKLKIFSCLLAVLLIVAAAVPAAFAATYQISDGLKFQLETEEVYLAGIEDEDTLDRVFEEYKKRNELTD